MSLREVRVVSQSMPFCTLQGAAFSHGRAHLSFWSFSPHKALRTLLWCSSSCPAVTPPACAPLHTRLRCFRINYVRVSSFNKCPAVNLRLRLGNHLFHRPPTRKSPLHPGSHPWPHPDLLSHSFAHLAVPKQCHECGVWLPELLCVEHVAVRPPWCGCGRFSRIPSK